MFPGRLGLQQRILPTYRAPFFDALASSCQRGLSVFAGFPLPEESIHTTERLTQAQYVWAANHHLLKPGSPFHLCWQAGLIEWLESWQPDVLIVEANSRYLSTRKAISWMHSRGLPVVGWGLGAPRGEADSPVKRFLASAFDTFSFIHSLDGMIAYSKRGAEEYCQLGFPADKIVVAPNATAPRPLTSPPARSPSFTEAPTILFVGRLQQRKRIDLLLQACAGLLPKMKPRLWIIGDGPALNGLKDLAARIYPSTEFLGSIHGEQLASYFVSADLFVLPGTG